MAAPKLPDVQDLGAPAAIQASREVPQDRSAQLMDQNAGAGEIALGRSLQVAGNELWELKEKTDTVKVEDAWNKYRAGALDLTSGNNGLLNTVGSDAVNGDLLTRSHQGLSSARAAIMESLSPDQQRRFAQRADVTDLDTTRQVLGHLTQQRFAYDKTVFEGNNAAALAQVRAAPTDPGVFAGARDTLMMQAETYGKRNGADKNTIDALKNKVSDGLWSDRITTLLYNNPALADSMLRANAAQINDPKLLDLLQAKTREASLGVTTASDADKIISDTRARLQGPQDQAPAPGPARAVQVGGDANVSDAQLPNGPKDRIPANVALARDQDRLRILQDERANAARNAPDQVAEFDRQIAAAQKGMGKAGATAVAYDGTPAYTPANTSGMPTSRDLAAQLPIMEAQVDKRATEVYGPDRGNPDRAAYVRRLTTEIHARVSSDVAAVNAIQKENQGILLDAVAGVASPGNGAGLMNTGAGGNPAAQQPKITSFAQIAADPKLLRAYQGLDVAAKIAIDGMMTKNLAAEDKGDYVLYRTLFNQINLPAGAKGKINFYSEITDPTIANRLSVEQIGKLRQEIDRWSPPGGKTWAEVQKAGDSKAEQFFKTNIMFTAQPERQIAATMRWNEAAQAKIDAYVKDGKDVRSLFTMEGPDSIVNPKYLQTFVDSTPAQGLAEGAAAVKAGGNPVNITRAPATIKTAADVDTWIKTLPPTVTSFVDPAGQVRLIPGRQPGQQPAPSAAAAPPAQNFADLQVNPATVDRSTWDKRADGAEKGTGFLGLLKRPDGQQSSEISISTDAVGGKDFPLLVPTLTRAEVDKILAIPINDPKFFDKVPKEAIAKAEAFAKQRQAAGLPLFATDQESPATQGVTMNDQGKIVQPAPPAPTPAQSGPRTADAFQVVEKPDTVAGQNEALAKARRISNDIRNQDIQWDVRQHPLEMIRSLLRGAETAAGTLRAIPTYLQGWIPTEMEAMYNGFAAIKDSGKVSRADEDVLRQVLKYGLLNSEDTQLAQGLLTRLTPAKKK